MTNFEQMLEKYADLAIRVGANLQPKGTLVIRATIEAAPFVRVVSRKAYELGAHIVKIEWSDDTCVRNKLLYGEDEVVELVPQFFVDEQNAVVDSGAVYMSVLCPNPDLYEGIDPKRVARSAAAGARALAHFRERLMNDDNAWTIVAIPCEAWAKKVFPNEDVESGISKLWEQVFAICRVDQADPIAAWKEHNETLYKMVEKLNEKRFKTLVYKSATIDLTIDLPEEHVWKGGGAKLANGLHFNPNIPTEEVFTMPHKDGVNGWVKSTLPFNYRGSLIEGMEFKFENGAVVEAKATKNEEVLQLMLSSDEGAKRLGEVALVPFESPIRESGHIFFNTLYDENASCHIALGKAYPTNLNGGEKMSKEELASHGVNDSLIHEDFMIGSQDLSIDGVRADGTTEPIFRNGTWALQ
ncbi:MAG: aminopeptidase [Bacilli bacterium]